MTNTRIQMCKTIAVKTLQRLFKSNNPTTLYQSLVLWVILFGCLFIIAGPLALELSYALPSVRPRTIPSHLFSEQRARDYYSNLTQHGPRVINTRADYLTRDFLISQIHRISSSATSDVQFDISLQNFTTRDIDQLQNIVVRISNPSSQPDTPCLMLVAHYDSVEFSPGGSDDGSGVVTLLEVLLNLINDPSIIFDQVHLIVLFTSAEELSLGGAEAFISNHTWKASVRRFINIDSTGSSGKAILFRVKPSQVVVDYARVPRPHANVIGNEILDLLGRDTDYSEFATRGLLPGYDFAFYLDGYSYHTLLDRPSTVEEGALQHLGENTLALSREILLGRVNLQQSYNTVEDDNLVYFDLLGRYLTTYKMSTSTIVQAILIGLVVLVGILMIVFDHLWQRKHPSSDDFLSIYFYFNYAIMMRISFIFIFIISSLLSIIVGILLPVVVAFLMSKIQPLSWFGNSTLAFFLFGLPCLIGMISAEALWAICYRWILAKWPKKDSSHMKSVDIDPVNRRSFDSERHVALLLVYAILMIISICLGYRSLYMILIWSIFVCPIYLLLILTEFSFRWIHYQVPRFFGERRWYWTFAPYIASLFPLIHSFEMTSRLLCMTMPMMGRTFQTIPVPHDVVISVLIALLAALFFLIFIPNIQRTLYFGRTLILLTFAFLIVFIIACTRHPFTGTHPKVVTVRHVSQSIYRIEIPTNLPVLVPLISRSASIAIASYDNIGLSPILDEFSTKTGQPLVNWQCTKPTDCTFDDTFNRTMAIREIELISIANTMNYKLIFRHVSSYQIEVSSMTLANMTIENSSVKPRTETIVIVQLFHLTSNFSIEMKIEQCDIADSPFLISLIRTIPYVVMWGRGRCQAILDIVTLVIAIS
ncbi:unnamed protein product [Rotaria magnacalcarata]|uniref:Peptidase M28 domain-containing protein n=4 Tax=Rotaria magnacalcarata TaxID=392030 RepID=A0A814P770_9BILA|nr:unnamed protein product [Rotaria magnacalcarata]